MNTPKPFSLNKKKFKAFVLGADPTNFTEGKQPKQLEYAFGILSDEPRYFSGILNNLNCIGLHLEDIYVQNVIQYYLHDITSKLKNWEEYAEEELPKLKLEFDNVDPKGVKPVLVTAERIMKFLVNDDYKLPKAKTIYNCEGDKIYKVLPKYNKLGRPLYALYRHNSYNLKNNRKYCDLFMVELK